jgi:hypothetical protein
MTMSKTKGYGYWRMSRLLGLREVFSSFHGGATNLPWEVVNDKVDSVVVDKPAPPAEAPSRRQVVEASKSVVEEERGETAENMADLKKQLDQKRQRKEAAFAAQEKVKADAPHAEQSLKSKAAFAGILGVGELGNSAWAIADVVGLDVTGQLSDVPALSVAIVVSMSMVITIVNGVAGSLATSDHSPRRRLGGWILLLIIAFALAGIRSVLAVEVSIWLILLAFVISLLAGIAAGVAHRAWAAIIEIRRAYRTRIRLAEEASATAEADVMKTEAAIAAAAARRRKLAAEVDAFNVVPQTEHTGAEDLSQIRQARRRQARYWYTLGQRFAGKDRSATGKGDADA